MGYRTPGGTKLGADDFRRRADRRGVGGLPRLPVQPGSPGLVPGLEYGDCNGPTLSLNLVSGVFNPR